MLPSFQLMMLERQLRSIALNLASCQILIINIRRAICDWPLQVQSFEMQHFPPETPVMFRRPSRTMRRGTSTEQVRNPSTIRKRVREYIHSPIIFLHSERTRRLVKFTVFSDSDVGIPRLMQDHLNDTAGEDEDNDSSQEMIRDDVARSIESLKGFLNSQQTSDLQDSTSSTTTEQ